jgi:hypothetical protein
MHGMSGVIDKLTLLPVLLNEIAVLAGEPIARLAGPAERNLLEPLRDCFAKLVKRCRRPTVCLTVIGFHSSPLASCSS